MKSVDLVYFTQFIVGISCTKRFHIGFLCWNWNNKMHKNLFLLTYASLFHHLLPHSNNTSLKCIAKMKEKKNIHKNQNFRKNDLRQEKQAKHSVDYIKWLLISWHSAHCFSSDMDSHRPSNLYCFVQFVIAIGKHHSFYKFMPL